MLGDQGSPEHDDRTIVSIGINPDDLDEDECHLDVRVKHYSHAWYDAEEECWYWCCGSEP